MHYEPQGVEPAVFSPNRLRLAIAATGHHTQESVARECGVTLRAVQKWASGQSTPTRGRLELLARTLGRDPGWFYETDDMENAA
jgi:hypothetical protein